ncbi:PspC domain-containing protein [Candidatus Saccharibacteria bacterium]|nr:PspC domain-containing protein [Candidatus Saccharibacteria bacterium]
MNEVTRIYLYRTTYEIDIDAKKDLEKYIAAIKKMLNDAEIIDDIELRMSEILAERGVEKDDVITASDVAAIRAQLGEPHDFADDGDTNEDWRNNLFTRGQDGNRNNSRKYYRDEENGILGGVAAGLSAYTGWDLTLVRVAFVLVAVLSIGWAILAYIIAWVATPPARTASEKLEMHGEPITLKSLKNSDFAKKSRDNAEAFVDDVKEKVDTVKVKAKKSKVKTSTADVESEIEEEEISAPVPEKRIRERHEVNRPERAHPLAIIFGVIFRIIGVLTMATVIALGVIAIVILAQEVFPQEIWLWLAVGAAVISGLSMVGFLVLIGQALMNRNQRRNFATNIAGTISGTVMFGFIASMFMVVWLWNIPRDYQLPMNLTHHIQRFYEDVCQINISRSGVEVLRKCEGDDLGY